MKLINRFFIAISVLLLFSCTCNRNNHAAKKETNVAAEDVKVDIQRFEKDFFACDPNKLEIDLPKLQKKYPSFYDVFYNQILQVPSFGDKGVQFSYLQEFLTNKYNVGLKDTVEQLYANMDFLKDDLKILFANYKSYFPKKPIPQVVTCITEFQIGTFTVSDSLIGISLDMYLGKNYRFYADIFKQYTFMIPSFDKKFMALDCANVLATNVIPPPSDKSTLLDKMLAKGKVLYMVENFLPNKNEKDVIKYDEKGWKFCVENEQQIWSYFLNKDLLYDTKFEQYKYITEAPTTYGMPSNSPGRVGAWLGWQIVRAYMKEHPNTTMSELLALKDGQKFLNESKYKPKTE